APGPKAGAAVAAWLFLLASVSSSTCRTPRSPRARPGPVPERGTKGAGLNTETRRATGYRDHPPKKKPLANFAREARVPSKMGAGRYRLESEQQFEDTGSAPGRLSCPRWIRRSTKGWRLSLPFRARARARSLTLPFRPGPAASAAPFPAKAEHEPEPEGAGR